MIGKLYSLLLCFITLSSFVIGKEALEPATRETKPIPRAIPVKKPPKPPRTPESDKFTYAKYIYQNGNYPLAIRQFREYLSRYAHAKNAAEAFYRLGESHLKLGERDFALSVYKDLIRRHPKNGYTALAAYRVASIYYNRKEYDQSAPYFKLSAKTTERDKIKSAATYYEARSYQLADQPRNARLAYERLVQDKSEETAETKDPYREIAMLGLAQMALESNEHEKAKEYYLQLTEEAIKPAVLGEALVQMALYLIEEGKTDEALPHLEKARNIGDPYWEGMAQYALIRSYYEAKDYERTIRSYGTSTKDLPNDQRLEALLMVGNAYRFEKQYTNALRVYDLLASYHREEEIGSEAAYGRLLCHHYTESQQIIPTADTFIKIEKKLQPESSRIDMAYLLKAEKLFSQNNYHTASQAFQEIRVENLAENLRADVLYKTGWANAEAENHSASIDAFSRFLERYPNDTERIPLILAKRGEAHKKLQNYEYALNDFQKLTAEYPNAEITEQAYQQIAIVKWQMRDLPGMIDAFKIFLERYPDSSFATEAYYWIGWAHFELQQWKEAAPYLGRAREKEGFPHYHTASLKLILSYYYLQDVDKLNTEITSYNKQNPEARIPPEVLSWAGIKYFWLENYLRAAHYLTRASDPENPKYTRPKVWFFLGKSQLGTEEPAQALTAFEHFLTSKPPPNPTEEARALLGKARAQLALKLFSATRSNTNKALGLIKEGRTTAFARLLLGDLAFAQKKDVEAEKQFTIVSELIEDKTITPYALHKLQQIEKKRNNTEKAEEYAQRLRTQYPNFNPKISPALLL